MPASGEFEAFVPAGLASLGIEADEVELAVMEATHSLYWPAIAALFEADLGDTEAEPRPDLSRAPE